MKHMEKSQKDFQEWKKQRERELMALRRQACPLAIALQNACICRHPVFADTPCMQILFWRGCWRAPGLIGSAVVCVTLPGSLTCCWLQGRKAAAHVQRLEALQAKQQAVLRRKTEEADAARKRLKASAWGFQSTPPQTMAACLSLQGSTKSLQHQPSAS